MAKSIKLKNEIYLDSSSIVHNKQSLEKILNYSTEEQIVGKWIDSKPIYRKVIVITSGFSTYLSVHHNINIDTLITEKSFIYLSERWEPLPAIYLPDIKTYGASVYLINSSQIDYTLSNWAVSRLKKIITTLEYTKTTD